MSYFFLALYGSSVVWAVLMFGNDYLVGFKRIKDVTTFVKDLSLGKAGFSR